MANPFFRFKQFTVYHDRCAMKVTTDACLFGAWVAHEVQGFNRACEHLCDVGSGTGLLSLMVAQKNNVFIDAVEIDDGAAAQAAENVANSLWRTLINIIPKDVRKLVPGKKYDVIFSNPPFYQNELKSPDNAKNKAHHDEGLRLSDLFRFISTHLAEAGHFFVLLPAKRETETDGLLHESGLFLQQKIFVSQTTRHSPFRMMICGSRIQDEPEIVQTISIKNSDDQYTSEFTNLLRDYYLYL